MSFFTSDRERRLWLWTLAVVAAIYATLGLARTLAGVLRDAGLIGAAFWLGLILIGTAVLIQGLKTKPSGPEIGVALGIGGAYLIAFLRLTVPEERSHLIEYSVVALLIHEALKERASQGRRVPAPAILALGATVLLGWLDEGIQILLPNRVFDWRDVLFNTLAALMAIVGSQILAWTRHRFGKTTF